MTVPTFGQYLAEALAPAGVLAVVRRHFPDRRATLTCLQGNIFVLDGFVEGRGGGVTHALGSRTMLGRTLEDQQRAFSAKVPALLADLGRFGLEDSGEEPGCRLTFVLADPK